MKHYIPKVITENSHN